VLDRVFVTREWDQKFPKVRLYTLTRVGSNHCPLLMDDGTTIHQPKRGFRFETAWLSQPDFKKHLLRSGHKEGTREFKTSRKE
jgi:hypothetical protein